MSTALYAVVDKGSAAESARMDGKALSGAIEQLDAVAEELGLPKLSTFLSMDPEEVAAVGGLDPADLPPMQWFAPAKALPTVRALLEHVEKHPKAVGSAKRVTADLKALEELLVLAQKKKAKFRLAMDY